MSDLAIKILIGLATKLLTESFLSRILVHGAQQLSKSTENTLDDKLVADLAMALGVDQH